MNISIRLIYGIIPVPVIWTDRFLDSWQGGKSMSIMCFIRPKYKDRQDNGIVEHELTHVRQFYRTLSLHNFLYLLSNKYRLNSEIEAYKNQLNIYRERDILDHKDWIGNLEKNKKWMANTICENYRLKNISYSEVYDMLSK